MKFYSRKIFRGRENGAAAQPILFLPLRMEFIFLGETLKISGTGAESSKRKILYLLESVPVKWRVKNSCRDR
jgi:hypothetical protein